MFIVACLYPQFLKINGDRDEDERRRRRSFSLQSPFFLSLLGHSLKRQRGNLFENLVVRSATLWFIVVRWTCTVSRMDSMIKGIYKGFKYTFSQLFVEKEEEEEEMKIGGPTDVKHVAHIGWDGSTETAPSWMNEFKAGNDYAATSISNSGSALSPWSSRDFSEAAMQQSDSDISKDTGSTDHPSAKKKERRKKAKPNTSPKTDVSKPSRPGKSKHKLTEDKPKPTNIEVA